MQTEILEHTLYKWLFLFWNFWIFLKTGCLFSLVKHACRHADTHTHFHIHLRDLFTSLCNPELIGPYKTTIPVVFQFRTKVSLPTPHDEIFHKSAKCLLRQNLWHPSFCLNFYILTPPNYRKFAGHPMLSLFSVPFPNA